MKKFETRLRIIMALEKLEGRRNLMGKALQPIDRVELSYTTYAFNSNKYYISTYKTNMRFCYAFGILQLLRKNIFKSLNSN